MGTGTPRTLPGARRGLTHFFRQGERGASSPGRAAHRQPVLHVIIWFIALGAVAEITTMPIYRIGCGPQRKLRPTGDVRYPGDLSGNSEVSRRRLFLLYRAPALGVVAPARRTSNSCVSTPSAHAGPGYRLTASLDLFFDSAEFGLKLALGDVLRGRKSHTRCSACPGAPQCAECDRGARPLEVRRCIAGPGGRSA